MFAKEATRLARIDWSSYGSRHLESPQEEWTVQDIGQAMVGYQAGLRHLCEELALLFGDPSINLTHSGTLQIENYESGAPPISPMDSTDSRLDPDDCYAPLKALNPDSYMDDDGNVQNGFGAVFQGVVNIVGAQNPNQIGAGGGAANWIGFVVPGAKITNLYVDNIYQTDGTKYFGPVGAIIQWYDSDPDNNLSDRLPTGWVVCNGTDNASGSGLDLRDKFVIGWSAGAVTAFTDGRSISGTGRLAVDANADAVSVGDHPNHFHGISRSQITNILRSHAASSTLHTHSYSIKGDEGTKTPGTDDIMWPGAGADTSMQWDTSIAGCAALNHACIVGNNVPTGPQLDENYGSLTLDHTVNNSVHTHGTAGSSIAGTLSIGGFPARINLIYIERIS
jgi:hypothetical protein